MAAIVLWRGGTLRIGRGGLVSCVLVGCLLPGANAVLFYAERDIPTGIASLIIASVPLWVVLLRLAAGEKLRGAALGGRRRRVRRRRGAAPARRARRREVGVALCLLSAVMWSVGSFAAARITMPADPFTATTYEMLAGGFVMLPFGLLAADSFARRPRRSSRGSTW